MDLADTHILIYEYWDMEITKTIIAASLERKDLAPEFRTYLKSLKI